MQNKLISIGEAAEKLGVSVKTLRRWDAAGNLPSTRSGPKGHRYYKEIDLNLFLRNESALAEQWAMVSVGVIPLNEVYCPTRDVFQARLEKLQHLFQGVVSDQARYLLCAVAGEIGNNSYDHNLGNWPDITGIYFAYDISNRQIVLADRGQGILKTLKRARPQLASASEALKVAFTETVSGRMSEARGNGLKFVRKVIIENPFTLKFQTGDAEIFLKEGDSDIITFPSEGDIRGCLAIIGFENKI